MNNSQVSWLRLEQEIPVELEESFYWLLRNLEIHRFSFEHHPENNSTQTVFVWLPFNEWSVTDQENVVESITSVAEPFELTLPDCKWGQV